MNRREFWRAVTTCCVAVMLGIAAQPTRADEQDKPSSRDRVFMPDQHAGGVLLTISGFSSECREDRCMRAQSFWEQLCPHRCNGFSRLLTSS